MDNVGKLMQNSLYGKLAQKRFVKTIVNWV